MVFSGLPISVFLDIKIGSFVTKKRFRKFLIPETSILDSISCQGQTSKQKFFSFLENLDLVLPLQFFHVLELILENLSDQLLLSIERHLVAQAGSKGLLLEKRLKEGNSLKFFGELKNKNMESIQRPILACFLDGCRYGNIGGRGDSTYLD